MKPVRLVPAAAVLVSLALTAAIAIACSDHKAKSTTAAKSAGAKSSAVAVSSGSACSAEQMAACASKGVKTVSVSQTASMEGDACCASKSKAKSVKASSTTATQAPVGKVNAMAVSSDGAAKVDAVAAGSSCGSHDANATAKGKGNCDGCNDLALCEDEVKANGAAVQVVPLKNGVMYVYTATGASNVTAVQAAMSRRNTAMLASSDKATLCAECKSMRGAIASGKLSRETVNIEGGCMTLVTSSDPTMVSKIYSLAGLKANGRNKS
jgi:hypothetical protein